jgi:hypothetical protein
MLVFSLTPGCVLEFPPTTLQLLLVASGLLVCAAILLAVRHKTRIAAQHALLFEEMLAYLARITDALEQANLPASDEITAQILRHMAEIEEHDSPPQPTPNPKVRQMLSRP